jgi:hypothetical protein
MVEESRLLGFIPGALNSTFLTLIPKVNKPRLFGDFRPISLCNLSYKIISKIIANRLNLFFPDLFRKNNWDFCREDKYKMRLVQFMNVSIALTRKNQSLCS